MGRTNRQYARFTPTMALNLAAPHTWPAAILPTMVGVVQALHIDMIFFGVFTIIALAVGQFTPPVGLNLFIASNIAQVKFESVVREIIPYLLAYVAMLVLFIAFPGMLTIFR